ncbi:hypothetical protein [Luteitalea sp. TBR-22]|uniref:hypothetical protein n=1 Tax=Luteitalea sp. TBR-22 TaxID=2802971 RepID=UPI001EF5DD3D|nr:hypothetical protein [Luteitalea sp. TBR-22]
MIAMATWPKGAAAADDPKKIAFDALSSMVLGRRDAFVRATLPVEGIDVLMPPAPPAGEGLRRIEEQLERVRFSSQLPPLFEGEPVDDVAAAPVGTRIVYVTQYGSSLVPVPVVRTRDGWRVDPRYWVAERQQASAPPPDDAPVMLVKRFLYHVMNDETEPLKALSYLPEHVEELTRNNNLPGADRGHVAMLAVEMGLAPARPGEVVRMPSGTRITAGSSPDELVFVGMMGSIEIPFRVRKVKGEWKVVPEPYFEYLRSMGAI